MNWRPFPTPFPKILSVPLRHIAGFSKSLVNNSGPAMAVEAREYYSSSKTLSATSGWHRRQQLDDLTVESKSTSLNVPWRSAPTRIWSRVGLGGPALRISVPDWQPASRQLHLTASSR
jgi:hypothetical protein